jgi:putative DNA methylase
MSEYKVKAPKKLIEVALPLKEINEACVREKSIRHGHPSTLHLYWARRPLAAARAVLFAQLVNDPGWDEELQIGYKRKADANRKREELFEIIRELVKWVNTNNEIVLEKARAEIRKSWKVTCELNKDHPQASEIFNPDKLPAFHDPFAGGGSIPLEAQRLGLEAWASDLNPVAVLINKAMIEIPPKFVGHRPIGPIPQCDQQKEISVSWPGVTGLAEDVRRYGHWVRQEAFKRIGHLYPPIKITEEMITERPDLAQYKGKELTVIAYIWARTVKSPNPLYSHVDVPLTSTFLLSDKKGKEAWIEPIIDGDKYQFKVRVGMPDSLDTIKKGTKAAGRTSNFTCLLSNTPIDGKYIKAEGQAGRMGSKLMAIVAEGKSCRVYLSPDEHQETIAKSAVPTWRPEQTLVGKSADQVPLYGMRTYGDLFSNRQMYALESFTTIIDDVFKAAIEANDIKEDKVIYQEAIRIYLHFCVGKLSIQSSVLSTWDCTRDGVRSAFGRQALAMVWDYAEVNILSDSTGNWLSMLDWVCKAIQKLPTHKNCKAVVSDATSQSISAKKIVSTDPPYYDNIMYADLSDFFYVFQKRALKPIFPELFQTIATPKDDELVASQYRHKSKKDAELFFLNGMMKAMSRISQQSNAAFPVTIYYAFKQSETSEVGSISTGWVTFLEAVIKSEFAIVGTWPMRTELANKVSGIGSNMLSSSIILVCRKRVLDADLISRKDFIQELNKAIPIALDTMINGSETSSPIAPVDLAQAAIGPGMAVFSKYKSVVEADGSPMSVRTALVLINRAIDDYFKELEGDWDSDTRFCLQWFSEYGWREGVYGEADVLARAKGVSVEGVRDSGVLAAGAGKVQLLKPSEYPDNWSPAKDSRMPVWEVLHHLIRLHQTRGESAAAEIVKAIPHISETARQLAFLLYTTCERKGWAEDARPYNDLVTAWLSIEKQARADEGGQIEAEF